MGNTKNTKVTTKKGKEEKANTKAKDTNKQATELTEKEILQNWGKLTQEQQYTYKENFLKSLYGRGGQGRELFPNLLDWKVNNLKETFPQAYKNFRDYTPFKENGEIHILPIIKGNKYFYTILITANKEMDFPIYHLKREGENTLQYTTMDKVKEIKLTEKDYIITNIHTNSSKAFNHTKKLLNLFQLYSDITNYKTNREGINLYFNSQNSYQLDINKEGNYILKEIGKNSGKPTGKEHKSIGEILGRKEHKEIPNTTLKELII